ncbi:MAG: desulfoferrodoxin [Candidatus Thermoplasmatota archaeon]|nr:desulfoferrodoxin [Candidatus Thermoplasmatota archaeon]MBS3801490.1 desulfoferrodoxin [Candidatus Thermoplasmatota archaeon]
MTELKEIYKCDICGNIVEVLHAGPGELVCCGEPMQKQEPKTKDASTEKHVPYIEKTDKGILVKVGQNQDHPMEEKHYIEWIQLITDKKSYRQYLKPGDKPQALFMISADKVEAREYCNVHGLWQNKE